MPRHDFLNGKTDPRSHLVYSGRIQPRALRRVAEPTAVERAATLGLLAGFPSLGAYVLVRLAAYLAGLITGAAHDWHGLGLALASGLFGALVTLLAAAMRSSQLSQAEDAQRRGR